MKSITTYEAKAHLSRILDEVAEGEVYVITRRGKPVAEIHARQDTRRSQPHPVLSKIRINYDPTEDLTADEWGELE